jgi:hypothetical protein
MVSSQKMAFCARESCFHHHQSPVSRQGYGTNAANLWVTSQRASVPG